MPLTRRDVLWGLGGGLAGAALTPVPWKLLDDTAIWTQRRHVLPVPPRGPVSSRPAACTLCPAGCPVRVRCVGPWPVAVVGEARHPLGRGACAIGLTLHHLAGHPLRLTGPAVRAGERCQSVGLDEATGRVARAIAAAQAGGQRVMVLDRRPGRVVSAAWRELVASLRHGTYATVPGEGDTLAALAGSLAKPLPLGIDLERTRTLVSFGAPVLEGWGRPGRMLAARPGLRVVQVDAWRSPSAALADEWMAIQPGGEGPLALALAHVISREGGARLGDEVRRVLSAFSPSDAAPRTGLDADRIEALARMLLRHGPAVAVGGGDPGGGPLPRDAERAIALLDVVLGRFLGSSPPPGSTMSVGSGTGLRAFPLSMTFSLRTQAAASGEFRADLFKDNRNCASGQLVPVTVAAGDTVTITVPSATYQPDPACTLPVTTNRLVIQLLATTFSGSVEGISYTLVQ